MLEIIDRTETAPSRLYVFSKEAQLITRKLLEMHAKLMQCPEGLKIIMTENRQEVRVPHNRYPEITLESSYSTFKDIDEIDNGEERLLIEGETIRRTMGAVYSDGLSMYLSFMQRDHALLDFREDPFTEHIADIYASHFDAA